jgi:hypothetical protein
MGQEISGESCKALSLVWGPSVFGHANTAIGKLAEILLWHAGFSQTTGLVFLRALTPSLITMFSH